MLRATDASVFIYNLRIVIVVLESIRVSYKIFLHMAGFSMKQKTRTD